MRSLLFSLVLFLIGATRAVADCGSVVDCANDALIAAEAAAARTEALEAKIEALEKQLQSAPQLSFHDVAASKTDPKVQTISIGRKDFCALSKAGEPHAKQACICTLSQNSSGWRLNVTVDESVEGACRCGAVCMR